ncbi:MAG: diphthine--ammonia ligase [Chloroflexi bacterium]|nr:diphthine--ammonia ligase [Chloroflexota bacterium]
MKVFSSWSGGKDSSLACHQAIKQGYQVTHLLNFRIEDGTRSLTHGLSSNLIGLQSQLSGIQLVSKNTSWETYEAQFKSAMLEMRREGVTGGIFGDIELQPHRDWIERVCADVDIQPVFPLWHKERMVIMRELISSGFESVVVSCKGRVMGPEWLGRNVNEQFIQDMIELQKTVHIDLCGEEGEYHTFVTAGPLFNQRIKITLAQPVLHDEYWYAEILGYELE